MPIPARSSFSSKMMASWICAEISGSSLRASTTYLLIPARICPSLLVGISMIGARCSAAPAWFVISGGYA